MGMSRVSCPHLDQHPFNALEIQDTYLATSLIIPWPFSFSLQPPICLCNCLMKLFIDLS